MMAPIFIILGLYIILCYYIGAKGKKIVSHFCIGFKHKICSLVYWLIYWGVALSFIFSYILRGLLTVDNWFISDTTLVGVIFLGILFYSILIFLIIDILKIVVKKINLNPLIKEKLKKAYFNGLSVFLAIFILLGYGFFNAQNKVITSYEVNINKKAGNISSLNVVMISDVHMGIALKENGVDKMVDSINQLHPDIVLFCGDIFDENTPTSLKEYSQNAFKNIKTKYGVYDITGNHEYNAGDLSKTIAYFKDANIKFLQDESVKVADSFIIIGRNDPAGTRLTGGRKALNDILKDVDRSLPIIVLNHRPEDLEEAEAEGVDLQLSGHTHNGQIFPGNLITKHIYEKDYGYLNKGNFNLIVSCGYGTWGPPIRIGTKSEIVEIKINFKN
ncbi:MULTISPECIES: metallophosphoesterase [unclassified Clostridium]|uniref:metallophosphoesterase n=1 Tax=unclassified Clostridium TaxID=2614128 RepID=UPI000297C263|nr:MULTISPECIES: metallophosphoesterase [unclassified Clostridium]EKQ50361.1 MAG: putative phosphohydrolase [Clostridium sp. Maddingley MBC34-26]